MQRGTDHPSTARTGIPHGRGHESRTSAYRRAVETREQFLRRSRILYFGKPHRKPRVRVRRAGRGCGGRTSPCAGKQDKAFRPRPETADIPVRGGEKAKQDKTTRPGVAYIPVRREKRTGNGGTIKTADRMENTVRRRVSASADKESGPPVSDFHSGSAPGAVIEPLFSLR